MTILRHPSLPEVLRRQATAIYLAVPESVAADISGSLNKAADELIELQETLRYIERWVNHHGQKPGADPAAILSMIQHYPPIKAITRSYADGKLPDTPDPWADLAAANARAERYREAAIIGSNLAHERNCATVRRGGTECNCSIAAIRAALNDQPEQPT